LATKDNLRNVKGIDFWDTNIIFAAISNNLADVMTHTDANQTFWDMLLMYHSDDPSEIEECFEVVSDFVRITQKKMANKP